MAKLKQYQSFLLRLSKSQRERAGILAAKEGISLNYFISLALAQYMTKLEESGGPVQPPPRLPPIRPAS